MDNEKKKYDIDKLPILEETDQTFEVRIDEIFYDDETKKVRVDFIISGNAEIALDWINSRAYILQGKYRARPRGA